MHINERIKDWVAFMYVYKVHIWMYVLYNLTGRPRQLFSVIRAYPIYFSLQTKFKRIKKIDKRPAAN